MQNDPHYIKSIVGLAERRRIVTHRPIHAANGMKLVDAGVHISAGLRDKLVLHKLIPAIDECLSIEGAVTPDLLAADIEALLADDTFGRLLASPEEGSQIASTFRSIKLNPVLSFKLTLAREQFPRIFRHSLEVALCASIITLAAEGFNASRLVDAAGAGLFHDLGLLHVDPVLLSTDHRLSEPDRQHIYTHPVVAHLILARFPEWHPGVSHAVLEHHERIDASGYPRSLEGNSISPLGQLLGVAEIVATLMSEKRSMSLVKHAQVILRLNQGKLNRHYADCVMALILRYRNNRLAETGPSVDYAEALASLVALSANIQHWHAIAAHFGSLPVAEAITQRITMLERNLAGVGIDLRNWGMIDPELPEAGEAMSELGVAAREGRWQLRAIAQEVERHWTQWRPANQQIQESIWNWAKEAEAL